MLYFVEFVVHSTVIWCKDIDCCHYNQILETSEKSIHPPPLAPRNYIMYCCSFILLNLTL